MKLNKFNINNKLESKYGIFFYKANYKNNKSIALVIYLGINVYRLEF